MNKPLVCDRVMYGALLGMIFFLPYSLALIETCQVTMIVAWIGRRFLQPRPRHGNGQGFNLDRDSLIWPLAAIGLLIVLTIPFSHYPSLSAKKFFTRFLQQIILAYLVTQTVRSRQRLHQVLAVLLGTLFLIMIDAGVQYFSGKSLLYHSPLLFGRISGPLKHPNDLGSFLVTVIPVVLAMILTRPKAWTVVISILFVMLINALGFTASRGAWLAFGVSIMALSIFLRNRRSIVISFLMLVFFFWIFGMHCLSTRLDMYSVPMTQGPVLSPSMANPLGLPAAYNAWALFSGSSGRELYWETAVNVIKHSPWFGCGYNAYMQTLNDLKVGHIEYPHNSLLQITAELGIIGLLLYGWFFTSLYLQARKALQAVAGDRELFLLGCGISSGILAWMVHSLLDTPWCSLQLNVLWWLLIGILMSLGTIIRQGEQEWLR